MKLTHVIISSVLLLLSSHQTAPTISQIEDSIRYCCKEPWGAFNGIGNDSSPSETSISFQSQLDLEQTHCNNQDKICILASVNVPKDPFNLLHSKNGFCFHSTHFKSGKQRRTLGAISYKQTLLLFELNPWITCRKSFVHRKPKKSASRCLYYPNSCASRQLLLQGGDISTNPGPDKLNKNPTTKKRTTTSTLCPKCAKRVQTNHKRFICTKCLDLYHGKCTNTSTIELKNVRATQPREWICTKCLFTELPFHRYELEHDTLSEVDTFVRTDSPESRNMHHQELSSRPNQLKILHLNTQSMLSTFDELLATITEYSFDVVAMAKKQPALDKLRNYSWLLNAVP